MNDSNQPRPRRFGATQPNNAVVYGLVVVGGLALMGIVAILIL